METIEMPVTNTGFVLVGVTCKLGALPFISSVLLKV